MNSVRHKKKNFWSYEFYLISTLNYRPHFHVLYRELGSKCKLSPFMEECPLVSLCFPGTLGYTLEWPGKLWAWTWAPAQPNCITVSRCGQTPRHLYFLTDANYFWCADENKEPSPSPSQTKLLTVGLWRHLTFSVSPFLWLHHFNLHHSKRPPGDVYESHSSWPLRYEVPNLDKLLPGPLSLGILMTCCLSVL